MTQIVMLPDGLEPPSLRLLAVRSNQLLWALPFLAEVTQGSAAPSSVQMQPNANLQPNFGIPALGSGLWALGSSLFS